MIYAASFVAIHRQTKEARHELFTFVPRKEVDLTPEQHAAELMRTMLEGGIQDEVWDCQLRVIPIDLSKHLAHHIKEEFQEESKEA